MARVYLANVFSLSMLLLPRSVDVCIEDLDLERWTESAKHHIAREELDCAIGHGSTARLAEQLLGMQAWIGEDVKIKLQCKRKMVALEPGDTVYVIQQRGWLRVWIF